MKASYVSLHVYAVYLHPELVDALSPELRSRMQGKSCFNFKRSEQVVDQEISELLQIACDSISGPS
jgi:hypothetical protein